MRKYYCDVCEKEIPDYELIETEHIEKRWYDLCRACHRKYEKLQKKMMNDATKEFFKKKGRMDILEAEDGPNE